MKNFLILISVLISASLYADTYLQSGQSQWVSSDIVHCGVNQPTEKRYTCTYEACLKSTSIHHISADNCEFFKGYQSYSDSVWAFSGSEAESKMEQEISSDSDITDYKVRSISCY